MIDFLKNDADDATTGTITAGGFTTEGTLTLDSVGLTSVQISSESFSDSDTTIMTSAAIQDKIESYGYVTTDTNTTYSAGTNISLDGTTFNVDDVPKNDADDATTGVLTAGGFTTSGTLTLDSVGLTAVQTSSESFADNDTSLMTSAAIADKIESYGYVTTDTNTTYTAGTNISLDGTTFNVDDAVLKNDADDATTGVLTAGGFTTTGTWTFDSSSGSGTVGITAIQPSTASFGDSNVIL